MDQLTQEAHKNNPSAAEDRMVNQTPTWTQSYLNFHKITAMVAYYDEIEIEDMTWDDEKKVFHYPCPCGDRFEISRRQLADYEDIATCPSCSLIIRVIYDPVRFLPSLPYESFMQLC